MPCLRKRQMPNKENNTTWRAPRDFGVIQRDRYLIWDVGVFWEATNGGEPVGTTGVCEFPMGARTQDHTQGSGGPHVLREYDARI